MKVGDIAELQARLMAEVELEPICCLALGERALRVVGNSSELGAALRAYFAPYLVDSAPADAPEVVALEREPLHFDVEWTDWPREAGKSGLKERYHDAPGGRLLWKVRTGMMFILKPERAVAVGECRANLNQVINLVNNQFIAWLMDEGHALCHAAGVVRAGAGLGMAGVSGAGKSTLALRLIDRGASFVSNDRLLVRREAKGVVMRGIPKMPRVNPGTLLSLPSLERVLPEGRSAELRRLPLPELWELEEKYDADIGELYGPGRVASEAPLTTFLVLSWSYKNDGPAVVEHATLAERPELLAQIEKHPGPFYHSGGVYDTRGSVSELPAAPYLDVLGDVPLLAISGGVDWGVAVEACEALMGER